MEQTGVNENRHKESLFLNVRLAKGVISGCLFNQKSVTMMKNLTLWLEGVGDPMR